QAVQREQRRPRPRPRLPVAVGRHARAGGHLEEPADRRRQPREVARVAPAVERHAGAVSQRIARLEVWHCKSILARPCLQNLYPVVASGRTPSRRAAMADRRRTHGLLALLPLLIVLAPASAAPQTTSSTTGAINGKAVDKTNAVLPGVT